MERRGCHVVPLLAGCPRGLSALSTSAAGLFSGKKKFRLISGHFEKFRLLYEKRKVETHIWTLWKVRTHIWQKKSSDSYLVHLIKFRLFYDINPKKKTDRIFQVVVGQNFGEEFYQNMNIENKDLLSPLQILKSLCKEFCVKMFNIINNLLKN